MVITGQAVVSVVGDLEDPGAVALLVGTAVAGKSDTETAAFFGFALNI